MTLLSLSGAIFGGFRGGFFTYSQSRVDRRIRSDLFRSLVRQEIAFFDENKTGKNFTNHPGFKILSLNYSR